MKWSHHKDRPLETIGFIGLGVMGEAMCRNLIASGHWSILAFDLNAEPLNRIERDGATVTSSATDLAEAAEAEWRSRSGRGGKDRRW